MKALLSLDLFLRANSEEKCSKFFKMIERENPHILRLAKIEKYWKDDKIYILSIKSEWEDDSQEKIVLQCLRLCDSFSHHWFMSMPEIENNKMSFNGTANEDSHIRHKGKGVEFIRFTLEATM